MVTANQKMTQLDMSCISRLAMKMIPAILSSEL